jgi:hypothetical protein
MNNIFKTNSRFASLSEDTKKDDNKKDNKLNTITIKENTNKQGIFESNTDYVRRTTLEQERKREEEKNIETEKINKMLSSKEDFPDLLITNKKQNNTNNKIDYTSLSEKIKNKQLDKIPEINEVKNVRPGWTIISIGKKAKSNFKLNNHINPPIIKKTENEFAMEVLTALCDLHEYETQNYIDKYGYDNWEKKYIDPDWDHEYFDRLDEEYEAELKAEERIKLMKEYENEYEDDYDY